MKHWIYVNIIKISEKITLRILDIDDANELYTLVDKNRNYLRDWLPWLDINTNVEQSEAFIKDVIQQPNKDRSFQCGVFCKDTLVGMCGFHPINFVNNSVTIGYWISKDMMGKGIITQCTKYFINYAFEILNLNKVCIPVAEKNLKSRAVSERLGLLNEGLERDAEILYGKYINHIRYSILRSEWRNT